MVEIGVRPSAKCLEDAFYFLIRAKMPYPKPVFRPTSLCRNKQCEIIEEFEKELRQKPRGFYSAEKSKIFLDDDDVLEDCVNDYITRTFCILGTTLNKKQFFNFMNTIANLFCRAFLKGRGEDVRRLVPFTASKLHIMILRHEFLRALC